MAEYDRIQKKRESRAVANSEAGNKQLKEFVDNRNSIVCQTKMISQIKSEIVQRERYPTTQSGRMHKPIFKIALRNMDYFDGPHYTFSGISGAGGRHSYATLGPTGTYLDCDSDANSHLPTYIDSARSKYPGSHLKAGHLLNAQFGGNGNNANNLTILSARGNANHRAYDEPVKMALNALQRAYWILWDDGVKIEDVGGGIKVNIRVNTDQPWDGETKIFKSLTCDANVANYSGILSDIVETKNQQNFQLEIGKVANYCMNATAAGAIIENPV